MRFLRSVKGNTRLDKIRSEVIKKEVEISGIQDVRAKYKQNWINHLERMENTRLPKHALNHKPREEIVDAPENDDNASMPEQVKRRNPWRKMMMMMMMMKSVYCAVRAGPLNKAVCASLLKG